MSEQQKSQTFNNKLSLFSVIVLAMLIINVVIFLVEDKGSLKNAAINDGTSIVRGVVGDRAVHCEDSNDSSLCISSYNAYAEKKYSALWLGNSQLHSINQMREDEVPATALLHEKLLNHKLYLQTFSQGNANLEEHFLLFNFVLQYADLDLLILPVFFDDMRETGIREDIRNLFKSPSSLNGRNTYLDDLLSGSGFQNFDSKSQKVVLKDDFNGLEGSIQATVESALDRYLTEFSIFWQMRGEIRGNLYLQLYRLRNFIFQIDASSVRKKIPGRYNRNMEALDKIIEVARVNNTKVLLYIPPLRTDKMIPYDLGEYAEFKDDIKSRSTSNTTVIDFEKIVPDSLWGLKDSTDMTGKLELDFMHFKGEGHKVLSQALYEEIIEQDLIGMTDDI